MELIALTMIVLFVMIVALFIYLETKKVELSSYTVPIVDLPAELSNFKIAHLSDIHYSPQMDEQFLKKMLALVNEQHPDIIFITGDLASYHTQWVNQIPDLLKSLISRFGTYVVPGNHDYCYGRKSLFRRLKEVDITVLKNEALSVGPRESPIHLIGTDDPATFRDDPEAVFEGLTREGVRIFITHSPDGIREAIREKVPLILTGHTHGGQVRLPIFGALYLPTMEEREFDAGWFKQSQSWIFVNRGLGMGGVPVRFLCPREIAIITLVATGSKVVTKKKTV
jgi:uncharacterized protein